MSTRFAMAVGLWGALGACVVPGWAAGPGVVPGWAAGRGVVSEWAVVSGDVVARAARGGDASGWSVREGDASGQVALAQSTAAPGRTARTLGEFLAELRRDGIEPTSPAARGRAEAYRADNGLLPEPLLKAVYPEFAKLQAEVRELSAAKSTRGGKLVVPRATVIWPQPLDFRQAEYAEVEFERGYVAVASFSKSLAAAPVVDMTGVHTCALRGLRIDVGKSGMQPGCGIFLGRDRAEDNPSVVRIEDCTVIGAFGDGHAYGGACVVNVGCEAYSFGGNNFRFSGRRGGAYYTGAYNIHRIKSPHGKIAGGFNPGGADPMSNCGGVIDDSCHFSCDGLPSGANPDERYIIRAGTRTVSLWIHDIYVTAKTPRSVSAVFVLGDEGDRELYSGVGGIKIENVHDEAFAAEFFVRLDGNTRNVIVRDCFLHCGQVIGYGGPANFRRVDGLVMEHVQHQPHYKYWMNRPMPVPGATGAQP